MTSTSARANNNPVNAPDALAAFISLSDYETPPTPTKDAMTRVLTRAREILRRKPDTPMITDDRLRRSTLERLDEIASPPACGPLVAELAASLADWLGEPPPEGGRRLIVMPPGDRNQVMAAWAKQQGHEILEPPARRDVIGANAYDLPVIEDGRAPLVIAALEDWFVRDLHGLALVRALLSRIDGLKRPVIVACNSWAWQYLVRAVQADAYLPAPQIFQPFDALRLRRWLSEIAEYDGPGSVRFRDAQSGDDIMNAGQDDTPHEVLQSLAARSRGIPWVAWRLWRRSLRRQVEVDNDDSAEADAPHTPIEPAANEPAGDSERSRADQTLWVIALEEFLLPDTDHALTLLLLQALLIHGQLPLDLLTRTVPEPGATRLLPALRTAGIVEQRDNGDLACAPAAYPSVRAGLTAAGFPIASV